MTIHVGDKVPSATLMEMQDGGPKPVKTDDFFAGTQTETGFNVGVVAVVACAPDRAETECLRGE